jgi:hypothetical protein
MMACAFLLCVGALGFGQVKDEKKTEYGKLAGILKSVDKDKNTITLLATLSKDGKKTPEKTHQVDPDAKITQNGKDVKLTDLEVDTIFTYTLDKDNKVILIVQAFKTPTKSEAKKETPKPKQ